MTENGKMASSLKELFEELKDLKDGKGLLWFGISGSWRKTSPEVERDVRTAVRQIMERGDGIVSGGALNVDWFATDEAFRHDPEAKRIRIFLPVVLGLYAGHYRNRAKEGVTTPEDAEELIALLERIKNANPGALIEHPDNTRIDKETYFERNTEVVNASDAVIGFQVNDSEGVGDTLAKASAQGKPVLRFSYKIE